MSSTCSTSISGWEDVHCQTSRFDIDKQSCPRALQPHVNTHSLDPSSAWGCPKQAATRAGSSQEHRSYQNSKEPLQTKCQGRALHSTSILGWEDVHCQTSRFEIDKQSCPRALQPHVNTHSLDPSSAWSCTKQASTGACSLRKNLSLCCFCFN